MSRERLAVELSALGLTAGRDVLVHCSLRRVGPPTGGPATMLAALRDVLGPAATVVVPAYTPHNSTTTRQFRRATAGMDPAQVAEAEAAIQAFDRGSTPCLGMGALAEHVRGQPGAVRSAHPQTSFAALGPRAGELMAVHDLDCHLGERSPLAALYATGAGILLLGVGYESCTALHLAEYRLPWPPPVRWHRCYTVERGERVRHDFQAVDLDDGDFGQLGEVLDREPVVSRGPVGDATARLVQVRAAVDFAVGWFTHHRRHRDTLGSSPPAPLR